MTQLFNLSGDRAKYCFSVYFSLGSSVAVAGNIVIYVWGKCTKNIF
jgi:hypothetical protein